MSTKQVAKKNPAQKSKQAQKNALRRKKAKNLTETRSQFNTDGLIVPRNEQDRMVRAMSSPSDRIVRRYLGMLMHPKSNMCRAPDSYQRPTGLVRSVTTYNVPIQLWSADPDTGKFAIAIQPWLGNVSEPAKYKIAMAVSNEVPWETKDFSTSLPYASVIEGLDVRTDINYSALTQPPRGSYVIENTTGGITPAPFLFPETANTSFMHYSTPGISMLFNATNNVWRLAPGQYQFNFAAQTADTFTVALNLVFLSGDAADFVKDYVQIVKSPDSKSASISCLITVRKKTVVVRLDAPLTTVGSAYTNCRVSIIPTYYMSAFSQGTAPLAVNALSVPNDDMGMIQQYRTVAMSALLTYTGPLLTNGGNVAGAYVSGATLKDTFFTNAPNPSFGRGQDWDRVATWNTAYNGELKNGIYAYWTPEDTEEFVFRPPGEMPDQEPPGLVIAGQYVPGQSFLDGSVNPVVRLEVVTIYETASVSQLLEIERCVGSQQLIDSANVALAPEPHVMQNATHMSWLKDFWGGLKKGLSFWEAPARLAWDNRSSLAPLMGL